MFARTGLRLIGIKLFRMSVAEAMEFYGGVKDVLEEKLSPVFGTKACALLEENFGVKISEETRESINTSYGRDCAIDQFNQIIEFMSGRRPELCHAEEYSRQGKVKSMLLVYEGEDAVRKIRETLGPTDPTKAPGGTIRREFGSDIMVNTAHASDSVESAEREFGVVKINQNIFSRIVLEYLKSKEQQ